MFLVILLRARIYRPQPSLSMGGGERNEPLRRAHRGPKATLQVAHLPRFRKRWLCGDPCENPHYPPVRGT
jgi:hypothetical protein